ncbi:hypothetical protein FRC19_009975, partial [Serendipita sp. 401]
NLVFFLVLQLGIIHKEPSTVLARINPFLYGRSYLQVRSCARAQAPRECTLTIRPTSIGNKEAPQNRFMLGKGGSSHKIKVPRIGKLTAEEEGGGRGVVIKLPKPPGTSNNGR